ncbi:MAG: outer membrane protein transport protein, partial [Duncaniella sp.]|nr:outer membrane protein transport protein [Duncaniella sp.]
MKKTITLLLGLALGTSVAMAEGYQVNTLSARQLGMGHTGIAMKLGAESQFFNPAGMAFMDDSFQASASFNAIRPTASATVNGKKYTTDCDPS